MNITNSTNEDDEIREILEHLKLKQMDDNSASTSNCGISHYEVECLLPDYLFDRLTAAERELFEIGINNYPDLEQDYNDAKILFDKVEKLDFQAMLNDKSHHLPERVAARLEARGVLYTPTRPNIKRLILAGVFAASLLVYMYFANPKADFADNTTNTDTQKTQLFTALEKEYLTENIDENDVINELQNLNNYDILITSSHLNDDINQYVHSTIGSFDNGLLLAYTDTEAGYAMLVEHAQNVDEDTFQEILNSIYEL
ncbi:MAG: hypothetical protein LBO69_05015 [Ignavibacteria bacterium]|jgi:hypothetical protein|nr:hypothetical protein [Ignavibacteria bacterium]